MGWRAKEREREGGGSLTAISSTSLHGNISTIEQQRATVCEQDGESKTERKWKVGRRREREGKQREVTKRGFGFKWWTELFYPLSMAS